MGPGPQEPGPCDPGTRDPGPFQNLKVKPNDSLRSLKVGPPHPTPQLSLMNSFFFQNIFTVFLLIYFCVFF